MYTNKTKNLNLKNLRLTKDNSVYLQIEFRMDLTGKRLLLIFTWQMDIAGSHVAI